MKKILLLLLLFGLFESCIEIEGIPIAEITNKQIRELEKISITDEKGAKYAKTKRGANMFSTFLITTTKTKMTKEDKKRVKEILEKYK